MKAVLMSIKPQYVAKILNKEKTIEIRKRFPVDYVGWVYIYVTKKGGYCYHAFKSDTCTMENVSFIPMTKCNGKVVARFWCDKVEEIKLNLATRFFTKSMNEEELLKQSCLTSKELENYLWSNICCGYAIHINKLEIFDKPKEISEFWNNGKKVKGHNGTYQYSKLTRAPQSWQFIEV